MARRIDISADREVAALRSIRQALAGARPPSRLLRVRPSQKRSRRSEPLALRANRAATPAATKAIGFAYLAVLEERFGAIEPVERHAPVDVDAIVFDRSALLALARGNPSARRHFERALVAGVRMLAPATVLLDARAFDVAREIAGVVEIVAIDAEIAMTAARLVASTKLDLPLEALAVACVAIATRAAFVSADGPGIGTFARAAERADAVWLVTRS